MYENSSSLKRSIRQIFLGKLYSCSILGEYLFLKMGKWCAFYIIFHWLEDRYGGRVSTLQPSHLSIDFEHRGCVAEHVVPECTLENIRLTYFIEWILI